MLRYCGCRRYDLRRAAFVLPPQPTVACYTHPASSTALTSAALGGDAALSAAAAFALYEPNPGLQDRAAWDTGRNCPFSASVSCGIGSASPQPVCVGVTFFLVWSFNNLDEWDSVSSPSGDYSIGPECASANTCRTLSQWGDCLSESVFGQSEELNLALRHLTLSS